MATHDDFSTAKYRVPVAVYCGSVPRAASSYQPVCGRGIDSSLRSWEAGREASLQTLLEVQMKKQQPYLWGEDGDPDGLKPGALWPGWQGCGGPQKDLGDVSQLQPTAQELEASSAAMETIQIKDKLKKRKLSEGLSGAPRGGARGDNPKAALPLAASLRLLPAPMPPILSIPTTPEAQGSLQNGPDPQGSNRDHLKPTLATQKAQSSLQFLQCNDEKIRKSLGGAPIPPIPKAGRSPRNDANASVPVPLPSLLLPGQGSPPVRSVLQRSPSEKALTSLEARTLGPPVRKELTRGAKPAGSETPSLWQTLSFSQATVAKWPLTQTEEDQKESHGKVPITISKSAQEKMRLRQKKELEPLVRGWEGDPEQEGFRVFQDQPQNPSPGRVNQGELAPLRGSGVLPRPARPRSPGQTSPSIILNKQASRAGRASLPSLPVSSRDSSRGRHTSAKSLPAALVTSPPEAAAVPEEGLAQDLRPLSHPELGLMEALQWLSNSDWQLKEKGLVSVRRLAACHPDVLEGRLHDVCLAVTREVSNLRSKVSRLAISTLGHLFQTMKKHMDQEAEEIARCLLQKAGDTSEFIQRAADRSLRAMVESVTPARSLLALTAGGAYHRNPSVRKVTAEHLTAVVEQMGAEKLLSSPRDNTDALIRILVKLAQDSNQDTRFYGRKMMNVLMSHPKFDMYLKQSLPSHDLRDIMVAIKQRGEENAEPPSAKGRKISANSSVTVSRGGLLSKEGGSPDLQRGAGRRSALRGVEVAEQLRELKELLSAKEHQARSEGVRLLLQCCRNHRGLVSGNVIQIFDDFIPRLQDSNKKVNQHALESLTQMVPLLKGSLHPVLIPVITAVSDNLNSKNSGIYTAAIQVLDTMIANLDNLWLLQAFAGRVRFLCGRAVRDITERLSVLVVSVYPRKPQAVERHILPVLWYFLSNMIGSGVLPGHGGYVRLVVSKLAKSLQEQMGSRLQEYASSQSTHVKRCLQGLLDAEGSQ
ncbi:TOG array regulator of axonemal microtubules protein 2 [Ornithorhynchus anatinus]|uniref:TOG array regulator of axonemal microtubules protein 2 n=1 Tax=Ornithorhynchus anatinus TaxID=9258 RepID=UPI0010A89076|nr:TOG array regulator of axonemal microtubules protein 2 [Ornithorhynchus anatinus]